MQITVLMGGGTSEHEISLLTGNAVAGALEGAGHDVERLVLDECAALLDQLPALRQRIVFVALHGGAGEDGRVQAALELGRVAYTGSRPGPSAVAMDKVWSKQIARQIGVPAVAEAVFAPTSPADAILEAAGRLGPATVFKPVDEGSAVGVQICADEDALALAIERTGTRRGRWMLEPYVAGRELTVGVVLDEACPVIEIRPKEGFYDYTNKYTAGRTEYDCPANLEPGIADAVAADALRLYQGLGLRDMARIDFRLDPERGHFLLEANTIPGMTATSLLPKAAAARGIAFAELCEQLCRAAEARGPDQR